MCVLCVCLIIINDLNAFYFVRESVGELSPEDVLFSSRASGKLETEPERDVTFVYNRIE